LRVGTFHESTIAETRLSDEARKILEEASAIAAQRRGSIAGSWRQAPSKLSRELISVSKRLRIP